MWLVFLSQHPPIQLGSSEVGVKGTIKAHLFVPIPLPPPLSLAKVGNRKVERGASLELLVKGVGQGSGEIAESVWLPLAPSPPAYTSLHLTSTYTHMHTHVSELPVTQNCVLCIEVQTIKYKPGLDSMTLGK